MRLKKNIVTIDNSLIKLQNLRGVYFDWRTEEFKERKFDTTRQVGLIAQEVERAIPELVSADKEGFKSVEYSKVVAVLIEAMKEQQKIITTQQKEIDAVKSNFLLQQKVNDSLAKKYDILYKALIEKGIIK